MKINNVQFDCTIDEVIDSLQKELNKRGISLLSKTRPVHDYLMVSCPYHNNGQEQRPSAQFRNSDGLFYCFAANTKIITHNGIKKIGDLENKTTEIINGNGEWEAVTIKNYGKQQLYELNLSRDRTNLKILTTKDHIWFDKYGHEFKTIDLKPNMYLKTILKTVDDFNIDIEGIRHGLIFGDGWKKIIYKTYGSGSHRTKDINQITGYQYNLSFYKNSNKHHLQTYFENDDFWIIKHYKHGETRIRSKRFDIDPKYKELPDISYGRDYIMSFLAGYIATDGNFTESISTANPDIVNSLVDLFIYCGINIRDIKTRIRKNGTNFTKKEHNLYTIVYVDSNIPKKFFINKYKQPNTNRKYLRSHWKINNIVETNQYEDVYCCTTSTNSFVLFGNILTHNCHACKECHSLPDVITYCLHENGWNWLRKNFASVKVEDRKVDIVPKKEEKKENTKTQYIPYEELNKYRYIHNYILNRGISKEILIKFDVGFDPESECITFPIKDIHGNILFIAKRSVNTKWYHYPMGVDKPLYGIYELNKFYPNTKSVIICESMINCLTCWTYGQPALALNGTGSYNQIRQLSKLPYREYILGLDPDNAGRMGSEKIINNLKTKKLLKQLVIPEGKDINDLTKKEFEALEIKNIF